MTVLSFANKTSSAVGLPFSLPPSIGEDAESRNLIQVAAAYVQCHMSPPKFDSSHDFSHIKRVVLHSLQILEAEMRLRAVGECPPLDGTVVILGALLHDVDDKKYNSSTNEEVGYGTVQNLLISWNASPDLASTVQRLCRGVSYSSEISSSATDMSDLISEIPEQAIVQDADRLDALGAVGMGRCFTFGGSRHRGMDDAIQHFEDKLLKLEALMKTELGREMARERSARIREFMDWWRKEVA